MPTLDDPRLPPRFWTKVQPEPNSGCWLWTAATTKNGYAKLGIGGRTRNAHGLAYEAFVGPVPDGLELDHKCRTRCCVNPLHLEAISHADNVRRGEANVGRWQSAKTHCPHGHPFDAVNTYLYRGGRRCKACIKATQARARGRWE